MARAPRDGRPDWRGFVDARPKLRDVELPHLRGEFLEAMARTGGRDRRPARPATMRNYRSAFDVHFDPAFRGMLVRELGEHPEYIVGWLRALAFAGYENKTRGRLLWSLSKLMQYAVATGAADQNPVGKIPREERPKKRVRDVHRSALEVLALEQIQALIDDDRDGFEARFHRALKLLTGARLGEVAALCWGDVNLEMTPLGQLTIARSYDSKSHTLQLEKADGIRYAPILPALRPFILEAGARFRARHDREPCAFDVLCPYIVPKRGGREQHRWYEAAARNAWRAALRRNNIADPSSGPRGTHCTRHTFITRLWRAGADVRSIAEITHASDAEMPARTGAFDQYIHPEWADLCAAALRLEVRPPKEFR